MGNWTKQAKLALSKGDYTQAGDFYKLDGDYRAAIKAYTNGNNFNEAAKIFESLGKSDKAEKLLMKYGTPMERAEFHLRNSNHDKAIEAYISSGMHFEAAELLEKLNHHARAAALFETLGFLEKAGTLYGICKNYDKAISVFTRLIESMSPNDTQDKSKIQKFRLWIANFHIAAKRFLQAGEIFEEAQQMEKAAKCYAKGGDPVRAAAMLLSINMLDLANTVLQGVNSLESRVMQGKIAHQRGDFEQAVDLLKDTAEYELLSEALEQMGRFNEAAYLQEKLGNLQGAALLYSKANDHRRAAILFEQNGLYKEAAGSYEAQEKWGHAAKLYHLGKNRFKAGYCLFKIDKLPESLSQLQMIGEDDPNYNDARAIMAEIFFRQGVFSVARQLFDELLGEAQMSDDNMNHFYYMARCCEEEGQFEEAKRIYERIVARRFNFSDAQKRLLELQGTRPSAGNGNTMTTATQARRVVHPADLTIGDVIADRFKVIETIGKGGMGAIFKVKDMELNRNIAIKMLTHKRGDFEELKVELLIARDLTHRYIIKVFDVGSWNGMGYFAMEAVDGEPLKNYIHNKTNTDLLFNVRLLIKICEGLKHAHDHNVVHRDIKPQNIMIDRNGDPKILDFGIARKTTHNEENKSISGSPKYMAPEQIQNLKSDLRTDVYAIGIIMFYMFTGREPFLAKTPQAVMRMHLDTPLPDPMTYNAELPYWLSEIIQKCCRKDPGMRFNNMADLIDELKLNLLDF